MVDCAEIALSRWLDEEGQLFEYSGQAPAPSKDFCQIVVSPSTVCFLNIFYLYGYVHN